MWQEIISKVEALFGFRSPFCPLYLVSALGIAWLWMKRHGTGSWTAAFRVLVRRLLQRPRQLAVDASLALTYLLFFSGPIASCHVWLFRLGYDAWAALSFPSAWTVQWPELWELVWISSLTMLAIDLAAYGMHRCLHELPGLWWIHRFHHSAEALTPFTTYRQHPLEPILMQGARGLAAGLTLGLLHLVWDQATPVQTVYGMGVGFFVYMFTVNLHHAPLPIRYPRWLASCLISPHIHHIHHSRATEHINVNYGVIFSFWDRAFGTYRDADLSTQTLEFGLAITKNHRSPSFALRRRPSPQ